jgi:hypothetical protein
MTDDAHARPADFDPERLDGQHTLVLGAPYLGKSHRVRESDHDHERVMRLDAALEAREGAFVVVDEFYTAYRGATEETRRAFRSWLDREGGVCVVARPRELDWLLDSDETPLSSAFLNAFDDIRLLRYPSRYTDETDSTTLSRRH